MYILSSNRCNFACISENEVHNVQGQIVEPEQLEAIESTTKDCVDAIETGYTKKGEKQRRKKFKFSKSQRQVIINRKLKQNHTVRAPYNQSCRKKMR